MAMGRYDGRLQKKLITSVKMAVSLCVIMLSLVAADNDTTPHHSDSTTTTEPTTTMLPHTEDDDGPVNVTVHVGSEIFLDCRINIPNGHMVFWSYMNPNSEILSTHTRNRNFIVTQRSSSFQAPNNYRLRIGSVKHEDEGLYYCLWAASLKTINQVFLKVTEDED